MSKLERKELINDKVQTILLQAVYPEIVSFLKRNLEKKEDVIQILRNVGYFCAKTIAKYWQPQGKSVQDMIKEIFNFILDNKSIEFKKDDKGNLRIIDHECRLCWEGLEEEEINYCITISSFLEEFINSTRAAYIFLPKVRVSTIQSKAAGAEYCEHMVEFL